jgi:hypothetical protein
MSDAPLIYFLGNTGPTITMRLSSLAGDYDFIEDQTVTIRSRPAWSAWSGFEVDATVDVASDTVSYTIQPADFTTVGPYKVWAHIVEVNQDSTEVDLMVFDHVPGGAQRVGAVWRAARALEPVAWDALRNYPDYGDVELQRVIELAKLRVLPTTVNVVDEDGLDPRVVDYLAKKVLVDNVLSAAISFWSNQFVAQTARGNSEEVATYPDRIRAVEEAIKRLRGDLARQEGEVDAVLGGSGSVYDAPMVNDSGPLLTPGLDEYPALPVTVQGYRRPWR